MAAPLVVSPATYRQDAYRQTLADLDELRLRHHWTFPQLAGKMASAGYPVKERTLYHLLKPGATTVPRQTTLYRIGRFNEWLRAQDEDLALDHAQGRQELAEREERRRRIARVGSR